MILARGLSRLVGLCLMVVLALCCLGLALYCLDALISLGSARPDRLVHLSALRGDVGHFLARIAASGSVALLALAGGITAVILGLLLLAGLLHSPPERRAILMSGDDGTLAVAPRPLRAMAQALAGQAEGATSVKRPKLALRRRGRRGRLTLAVAHTPNSDRDAVSAAVSGQLQPLSEPLHLRARVRVREAEGRGRVQ